MVATVVPLKVNQALKLLFPPCSAPHPLRNPLIGRSSLRNVDVTTAETQSNPVLGTSYPYIQQSASSQLL